MQVFCKNECKIEKKEDAEEVKLQKKKEGKGKEERRKRKRRKKKETIYIIGVGVCVKVGGAMGSCEIIKTL